VNDRADEKQKAFLRTKDVVAKTSDPTYIRYLSRSRLDMLRRALVVFVSTTCILFPVFILFLVPMSRPAMVLTVLAWVIPFSTTISVATGARDLEVIIGTSA